MTEQGTHLAFTTGEQQVVMYEPEHRQYFYSAKTSRDIYDRDRGSGGYILVDSETGALKTLYLPTGEHAGNTIFTWLLGLHQAWVFGLPYRIFLCVLGIVIAMLSYTGVYIWWRKRKTRVLVSAKVRAAAPALPPASAS